MWRITKNDEHLLTKDEFDGVKELLSQVNDELENEFILKSLIKL